MRLLITGITGFVGSQRIENTARATPDDARDTNQLFPRLDTIAQPGEKI